MAGVTVTPYFTPTSITGCRLWLDGADPLGTRVIPANASSLTTWFDKSGNGFNATANGTAATYNTNAVVFAGAQNYGTSLSSTILTQSAFAVISYTGSAYMDIISVNSTSGSAGLQQIINSGTQRITSYGGAVVVTGSAVTASTVVLYNYTFNSGVSTFIYLNGTQTGTSTGSSISGSGTISIGSYNNSGGLEPFTGNMYELILFNVVLTTTQRQQVESYLAQKWNFTSSLPADHPGRNAILFRSLITPVKVTAYSSVSFAFAPTQISGCSVWLDASDTTTITSSSGTLSQWRDKSTNALVMGQLGGTAFPTVSTAVSPNGLQTVNFTSSQSLASTGNLTLNGPVSIFIVFNAPSGTSMFFLEHGFSGSGTTLASGFYIFGGNGTYWDLKRNGTERCASIGTVGSAVFSNNTWYQTGFVDADATTNTSDLAITRNGSSLTPSWYNAGQGLGSIASGSFSAPFYINPTTHVATATYYGEIIIYNAALGVSDRQKVESYLAQKWGVQSSLAAAHPGLTTTYYLNQSFLNRAARTIPVAAVKTTYFLPTQISNCLIWFDADDSTKFSLTGTTVNSWTSKGSYTGNATSRSGTCTRGTATFNGLNVIQFPVGSELGFTATIANQPRAWFAVFKQTSQVSVSGPNFTQYFSIINQTSGNGQNSVFGPALPTNTGTSSYSMAQGPSGVRDNIATGKTVPNGFNVMKQYAWINSAASTASNFITVDATSYTLTENFTATSYATGSLLYTINTGWYNNSCDLAEIILYNGEITTVQRQQVEGYLAQKWGLTSSLPAGHPGLTSIFYRNS